MKCAECREFKKSGLEGYGYCHARSVVPALGANRSSFLLHVSQLCWKDKPLPGPRQID